MSKKSHHFLTLWPWPLTYDLEKLIRSGHYHYQCVYQIWEQSIPWFLSYRVNTIAGGGRLRRKTITSPDPSDTGDIITDGYMSHSASTSSCRGILIYISLKFVPKGSIGNVPIKTPLVLVISGNGLMATFHKPTQILFNDESASSNRNMLKQSDISFQWSPSNSKWKCVFWAWTKVPSLETGRKSEINWGSQ